MLSPQRSPSERRRVLKFGEYPDFQLEDLHVVVVVIADGDFIT